MGLDTSIYEKYEKIKVVYRRPKFEGKQSVAVKSDEFQNLNLEFQKSLMGKTSFWDDYYFLSWRGSMPEQNYEGYEKEQFPTLSKRLSEAVKYFPDELKATPLIRFLEEKANKGYAFATRGETVSTEDGDERRMVFMPFKELESYEVELWDFDEEVDTKFPNAEIPNTFDYLDEKYGVNLKSFLIYTENIKSVKDEQVLMDNQKAINMASGLLGRIEKGEKVGKYYTLTCEEVLKECIRVWEMGCKITIW